MTEQSRSDRLHRASNDIMDATSFLYGANAAFLDGLYAQYLADPMSVEEGWRTYFVELGDQGLTPAQLGRGPAWKRDQKPATPQDDITQALSGAAAPPSKPARPGETAVKPGDRASALD